MRSAILQNVFYFQVENYFSKQNPFYISIGKYIHEPFLSYCENISWKRFGNHKQGRKSLTDYLSVVGICNYDSFRRMFCAFVAGSSAGE